MSAAAIDTKAQGQALTPNPADMREHLEHLFGGYLEGMHDGLIELAWTNSWPDKAGKYKPTNAKLFGTDEIDELVEEAVRRNQQPHVNTYIGAALKHPETPRDKRTSDSDFYCAPNYWTDLDDKEANEHAKHRFNGAPPSMVVRTGQHPFRRHQLWWRLTAPIDNADRARAAVAGITTAFAGDSDVKNPGRLMRLAGSIAWNNKPGRIPEMTQIIKLNRPTLMAYIPDHVEHAFPPVYDGKQTAAPRPVSGPDNGIVREKNSLGLDGKVVDGRERHMVNVIYARFIAFCGQHGAAPTAEDLFDYAWPVYEAGTDLARAGRGQDEFREKCRYTVRRFEQGKLRGAETIEAAVASAKIEGDARRGYSDATATPTWPTPVPIASTLPAVEPFGPELLPPVLRNYVMDVADRQQAPPDFAAVTALCGLAAVAGNRVRIRPKRFDDWTVVPNLWGAIVGRPSAMKTPAMRSALGAVYKIEEKLRAAWEAALAEAALDGQLAGLDADDAKKRAKKALAKGDREEARRILAALSDDDEEEPPCPRLVVNDATVEKLGELLNQNPNGLLLIRDELPGFLAKMEDDENQGERAFYLEAFNGDGRFTYDRIARGTVHIENCTLSLIGGVQPSRIAPIVRGAMSGAANDGLIQRLQLTVWPDDSSSWRYVDREPNTVARLAYESAFLAVHEFAANMTEPAVFRFTDDAQPLFVEWVTEIQRAARGGELSSALESHLLKMPKTVAGLALLFELVMGGRAAVGRAALEMALGWADFLTTHAKRLYAAGETMAENGAKLILERRRQLPVPFTVRVIHKKDWAGLADRETVAAAVDLLVATHHCRPVEQPQAQTGGRPTTAYIWNPALDGG